MDPIEEMLFVTGGFEMNTVSMYTAEGWQLDLPDLVEGRKKHACTSFLSGDTRVCLCVYDNYRVLIVLLGSDGDGRRCVL